MLEKLRSLFASAPKTLPQATATLTEAQAQLETLAAELTTRDEKIAALALELAEAEKQGETATAQLATVTATLALRDSTLTAFSETFAVIGLADITNQTPAAEVKTKFSAHVEKATTLALAKTGHPPAHVPAVTQIDDLTAPKTSEDAAAKAALAEYEALIAADNAASTPETAKARADFNSKHHARIIRGLALRRRG